MWAGNAHVFTIGALILVIVAFGYYSKRQSRSTADLAHATAEYFDELRAASGRDFAVARVLAEDVRVALLRLEQMIGELSKTGDATNSELKGLRSLLWDLDQANRFRETDRLLQVQSLLSLYTTLNPSLPLPPLGGWALSADVLVYLVERVLGEDIVDVLELGSGASTVVIGLALEKAGRGHLTSIEQDVEHFERTAAMLEAWSLKGRVSLHLAPLRPLQVGGEEHLWYATDQFVVPASIDLVVIDGPSPVEGASRFPAVPFLLERMSTHGFFLLDDAGRDIERSIVQRWLNLDSRLRLDYLPHQKGTAVLTKE